MRYYWHVCSTNGKLQWQKKGTHKNEIGLQNNNCPTCDVCGYVLDWAGMGEVNKRALSFELYNGLQKDKAPKLFEKLYGSSSHHEYIDILINDLYGNFTTNHSLSLCLRKQQLQQCHRQRQREHRQKASRQWRRQL